MELMLSEWTHRAIVYAVLVFLVYRNGKLQEQIDSLRKQTTNT